MEWGVDPEGASIWSEYDQNIMYKINKNIKNKT